MLYWCGCRWYRRYNLGEFGLSERSLLLAYYIAASTAFEPEKSGERLAWATTALLVHTITSQQLSHEQRTEFVDEFEYGSIINNQNGGRWVLHVSQINLDRCINYYVCMYIDLQI